MTCKIEDSVNDTGMKIHGFKVEWDNGLDGVTAKRYRR